MKQSQDPFEAAFVEQEESPPESPITANDIEVQIGDASVDVNQPDDEVVDVISQPNIASTSTAPSAAARMITQLNNKLKDEDEDDEEEMEVELGKFPSTGDPDKMAMMQTILSQFTEEQMSRYESFRRSGFQKSNMKKLLVSVTGSQKISVPMTIAVSGIAKMFVGDIVETGVCYWIDYVIKNVKIS